MGYCMVLTTCPNGKAAEELARGLVQEKLAACVQVEPITSVYTWEGKVEKQGEVRLVIKTRNTLYSKIEAFIQKHHGYEVPQILQIPIQDGLVNYLNWIDENTESKA